MTTAAVFSWPRVVTHLSPGLALYNLRCPECETQLRAVGEPFVDVLCPVCGSVQHTPGPDGARGSDGYWIDPGNDPAIIHLN